MIYMLPRGRYLDWMSRRQMPQTHCGAFTSYGFASTHGCGKFHVVARAGKCTFTSNYDW